MLNEIQLYTHAITAAIFNLRVLQLSLVLIRIVQVDLTMYIFVFKGRIQSSFLGPNMQLSMPLCLLNASLLLFMVADCVRYTFITGVQNQYKPSTSDKTLAA